MNASSHGGPDALGIPRWDFSTNANACGPAPMVLRAVQQADATRYPDPHGTALREALARFHRVTPDRIVLAASASEFIRRLAQAVALQRPDATVHAPSPGYGDYAQAAQALGLSPAGPERADLVWHTEPASPTGQSAAAPAVREDAVLVIDAAYAPLRLDGVVVDSPASAWRLVSPNKALGLTGVRAAYAVAPPQARSRVERLEALAPSWPVGAHGVAMLQAWIEPATQAWVQQSCTTLADWKLRQLALLRELGWHCADSVVPFFVARWDDARIAPADLRRHGVKLRDTTSMGLPGHVRVSVQPPAAQEALRDAWLAVIEELR